MPVIGRHREIAHFDRLLKSQEAEFLAVYGRRRVGKTFLIREYLAPHLAFEMTGIRNAPLADQLANFHHELRKAGVKDGAPPGSWQEAFGRLAGFLAKLPKNRKQVVFFDELPWLAGRKSKFLPALDHLWNTVLSRQRNILLIVCGSAASWMIGHLFHHKGGLPNRVTARMRLEPFTLAESEEYLRSRRVILTPYDHLTRPASPPAACCTTSSRSSTPRCSNTRSATLIWSARWPGIRRGWTAANSPASMPPAGG
jgi:AAA+ ATPase superfamily predicted ATPase